MAALYGATAAGVEALFPPQEGMPFGPQSVPTLAQVTAWIDEAGGRVFAKVGSLTILPDVAVADLGGLTVQQVATNLARQAVHLHVASLVEASRQPGLARPNDTTSYASWLQARYTELVDELAALVDRNAPGTGVPVEVGIVTEDPAWGYVRPTIRDDTRF